MSNYLQVFEIKLILYIGHWWWFKMGDMNGRDYFMKNHTLSQQDCGSDNGDVISGYGLINCHALSQGYGSSAFK